MLSEGLHVYTVFSSRWVLYIAVQYPKMVSSGQVLEPSGGMVSSPNVHLGVLLLCAVSSSATFLLVSKAR